MNQDTFARHLNDEEMVIYRLFRQMQDAMIAKDMDSLRNLISNQARFVHMSGAVQSKGQYLKDIESNRLNYEKTVLKNVDVAIFQNKALLNCKAYLTANAYGAYGTFPMTINTWYQRENDTWKYIGHDQ